MMVFVATTLVALGSAVGVSVGVIVGVLVLLGALGVPPFSSGCPCVKRSAIACPILSPFLSVIES